MQHCLLPNIATFSNSRIKLKFCKMLMLKQNKSAECGIKKSWDPLAIQIHPSFSVSEGDRCISTLNWFEQTSQAAKWVAWQQHEYVRKQTETGVKHYLVLKHVFFINAWETKKKRDLWFWNFRRRFNRNRKSGQMVIIKDFDFLCSCVPSFNRSDCRAYIHSLDSVESR